MKKVFITFFLLFLAGTMLSANDENGNNAAGNSGIIAIMLPEHEKTRWQHDAETLKALAKSKGYKVYSDNCCYEDQKKQNDEIKKFLDAPGEKRKVLVIAPMKPQDTKLQSLVEDAGKK